VQNVDREYDVSVNVIMSMHVNYISMLNSHGCTCMVYMHDLCVYRTIFLCLCMPVLYCVPRKFAVHRCSNVHVYVNFVHVSMCACMCARACKWLC
jgi:hypothetical protein